MVTTEVGQGQSRRAQWKWISFVAPSANNPAHFRSWCPPIPRRCPRLGSPKDPSPPGPPVNNKQASTDQQVSGQRRISQARAIDRMSVLCRLPRGCSVGTQLRRWQHQASHFYDMLEAMVWALRRIGTCAYHRTTSRMRAWRFNATGLNYLGRRKLQKRCHDDPHLMEWNRQNIPYWAQKHALAAGHSADLLSKAAPQVDSSPHTPDLPTLRFAGVTPVSGRVTHPELTPLDLGPGVQLTGKYRPTATDDCTPTHSASGPAAQETAQEQVQVRLTKIAAHQQLQLSRAPITRRPSDQGDYSAPQLPHRATLRINTSAQAPAQAHRHRHTGTGAQAQHYSNSTATGRPSDRGDYSALQLPHGATLRIDTSAVQVLTQAQTARHPHRNSTGTAQAQQAHSTCTAQQLRNSTSGSNTGPTNTGQQHCSQSFCSSECAGSSISSSSSTSHGDQL